MVELRYANRELAIVGIVRRLSPALFLAVCLSISCDHATSAPTPPPDSIPIPPSPKIQYNFQPSWSADGNRIVYTHYDQSAAPESSYQIWEFDTGTSAQSLLAIGTFPSLSTGDTLALVRNRDIYVLPLATRIETRLTFSGLCTTPAWSPVGGEIAYLQLHASASDTSGISIMRPDGTGNRLIIPNGFEPSWAHDGKRIVFVRIDSDNVGDNELFVFNRMDSTTTRLTSDQVQDNDPSISPDNSSIAWAISDKSLGGVWRMSLTNGARTHLGSGGDPSWSPDGTRIVYTDYLSSIDGITVWIMNGDGSGRRPLFVGGGALEGSRVH